MLPLSYKDSHIPKTRLSVSFKNIYDRIGGWLRFILSDRNTRNLFLFFLLNFSFAFVELIYGIWTNSLGLISDSFHMFFDCTGLVAGLVASVISKWRANEKYSFGYARAEVLAGFVNGLFLLFIAFFILSEAVERAIEPPEVKHERMFIISVLGFLVNLIGIYAFQHGHAHGNSHGHAHSNSHGHSHELSYDHSHHSRSNVRGHVNFQYLIDEHDNTVSSSSHIMRGVFLHILADTLGSVGIIVSSILMHMFGWMRADPICSMFIAVLIAVSVLNLIKESIHILMQRQPTALDLVLPDCYQKVMQLVGVYSIQEPHFWTLSNDYYIGAVKVEVSKEADPRYITTHAQMIFSSVGVKQVYIQLDYGST